MSSHGTPVYDPLTLAVLAAHHPDTVLRWNIRVDPISAAIFMHAKCLSSTSYKWAFANNGELSESKSPYPDAPCYFCRQSFHNEETT